MPFESTKKYQNRIEEVRSKPQNTYDEAYEKKEEAQELRMEVMLDNARLMQELTVLFEYSGWATEEELGDIVKRSAEYLAHPEVAQAFIQDLIDTRDRVYDVLGKMREKHKGEEATFLYNQLTINKSKTYLPKGRIALDKSYPLALVLFVENSEDFAMIDCRENIGGFYRASQPYVSYYPISDSVQFPVIVIKGYLPEHRGQPGEERIEQHEKGHAENERFKKSLQKVERKAVWLKTQIPIPQIIGQLNLFYKIPERVKGKSSVEHLPQWSVVMDYALERAKDELLAEFTYSGQMQSHLNSLQKKGGVYDYFAALGIKPDSELYNDLWKKYDENLNEAVKTTYTLLASYRKFSLDVRMEQMRWVLAQIPMRDWDKQIRKSAFLKEALWLSQIEKENTQGSEEERKKTREPYNDLSLYLASHQKHSFIPQIKKYFEATGRSNQDRS